MEFSMAKAGMHEYKKTWSC